MKQQITRDMLVKRIEQLIIEELKGKELWGDIDFSVEDYEGLRDRLKDVLDNSKWNIADLCTGYPVAVTTFMVFMMRYKYDKNFWGLLADELGINLYPALEGGIGACARNTFTKYGFDFSDVKDERRVNMEPILFEAGLPPESSLDDLFYVLNYDSHSIFDPQLIIEDLVDMRSYHIRKPMLKFLKRYQGDRAVEFVLEVHDAMLSVDQSRSGESRYIGIYSDWKTQESSKETRNTRKKQEFQTRPYLSFENGKRGLCMVLPRTIMINEWIDDVEWRITCVDGTTVTKRMDVFGDEGRRFVQSIQVPICASSSYNVSLIDKESDDNAVILEWAVEGVKDNGILFFNVNGRLITPNYLQVPYGIMLLSGTAQIKESKYITTEFQAYPTDREGYSIVSIEPTGRDAELVYTTNSTCVSLKMRPQINLTFDGKLLFGLSDDGRNRLFTDIPELNIDIDESAITTGLNLRIGKEEIDISKQFNAGIAKVSLKKYAKDLFPSYGTYSIRLYQDDHFLRQVEFSYVPKIKTNYSPKIDWPSSADRKEKKIFKFERKDDWEIEFDGCVVNYDEENYIVECPTDVGVVYGRLKSTENENSFTCGFELPINPFSIEVLDSAGMPVEQVTDKVTKITIADIDENEYWIGFESFGDYKNNYYKIRVRTANGIEQEEYLRLTQNGGGNINLANFYDTLRECPLPAQIELCCNNEDDKVFPILVLTDSIELNKRPALSHGKTKDFISLSLDDDEKDITVRRFGTEKIEWTISYDDSRLNNKGDRRGYPLPDRVIDGIYIVEGNKQGAAFMFEDESSVLLTHGKNILYVSDRKKEDTIETFSHWLDQLIKDIIIMGVNQDIKNTWSYSLVSRISEIQDKILKKVDYELLAALAYFIEAKCIDAKKESISECMEAISKTILDSKTRLEFIRVLAEMECPQEIFDICLEKYNLLLFETGADDAKYLAGRIENNSTELSMLLLMGSDASVRDTIWREKYRELIGREAIRSLLSVPNEEDPVVIAEEQKKFFREVPCNIKIELNSEIAGDMGPIREMVDYKSKIPKIDVSKKPDFGIYFDRIRYVDQYVNWYTKSHTKEWDMIPWKRSLMLSVVKDHCMDIMKYVSELKKDATLRPIITRYEAALSLRIASDIYSNLQANDHSRYFYLQGMAAFLAKLPAEYRSYGWAIRTGEAFMTDAMKIAPRMARRDLVMSSTFIYLMRKEEKLCR